MGAVAVVKAESAPLDVPSPTALPRKWYVVPGDRPVNWALKDPAVVVISVAVLFP